MTFTDKMGIELKNVSADHAEGTMTIQDWMYQPFGFLHGGVTLTLIESVASALAEANADLATELPFGTAIDVKHCNPGRQGVVSAVADVIERKKSEHTPTVKIVCAVAVHDEAGRVMSEGTFTCKVVPRDYLAKKWASNEG